MYLETVDSAISNPSFSSSPWIRGAPHRGFSLLICRMSSRSSRVILGRPRSGTGFPAPIGSKPCSMPAQNRVRQNHAGQTEQAWPEPCHPHQQDSVSPTQTKAVRCTPHRDIELMAQIQVLDFKPTSRLEPVLGQDAWVSSVLIMSLSATALIAFAEWEEWGLLILGLWLAASPWVLGFQNATAMKVNVGLGLIVAAVDLWLIHYFPSPPMESR